MTISKVYNNSIIYPTGVYYEYNLYLIEEYNILIDKILNINDGTPKTNAIKIIESFLKSLEDLLKKNISNDINTALNVLDWEDEMDFYYNSLIETYKNKRIKNKRFIKSINSFLRKEKLKKINDE